MQSRQLPVGTSLVLAFLLASCGVPFGSSYRIKSQAVRASYLPSAGELEVDANWRLRNSSSDPLDALELRLPASPAFGAAALAAEVNARATAVSPVRSGMPGRFVLSLDPPWSGKRDGVVRIRYRLALGSAERPSPAAFYLGFGDWFPELAPPPGRFSRARSRGREVHLQILVPREFRVLTAGELEEVRTSTASLEYRFLGRHHDGPPFLLAGRYEEQKVFAQGRDVILWTFGPLPPSEAQTIAARLARAAEIYRKNFGALAGSSGPIWIVEQPDRSRLARPFAEGVLLDESWFAQARTAPDFVSAERALAGVWFGIAVRPEPDAAIVLGEGAPEYATLLAEQTTSGPWTRRSAVTAWLARYDRARIGLKEVPILQIKLANATPATRELAASKAALFYIALEDHCGATIVRRALAHLVRSLRGSSAGLAELRSALEEATGQDLAEFFREWLEHVGIPGTFRARYQSAGGDASVE